MQRDARVLLLIPLFFAIELGRAVLWIARGVDEPDRDGPLLRALIALLVSALSVVPRPVWRVAKWVVWLMSVPATTLLRVCGVGRENIWKRPPGPVTRWYAHTRARRAKMRRRQRRREKGDESE